MLTAVETHLMREYSRAFVQGASREQAQRAHDGRAIVGFGLGACRTTVPAIGARPGSSEAGGARVRERVVGSRASHDRGTAAAPRRRVRAPLRSTRRRGLIHNYGQTIGKIRAVLGLTERPFSAPPPSRQKKSGSR